MAVRREHGTARFVGLSTDTKPYLGRQRDPSGTATGNAIATANIPIVALYPSFVCQSSGTNDPIMHLRGYRIYQSRA